MSDKMRESFEKWAKSECLDTDSVDGFYSDNDTHIAWGSWQAAQSNCPSPDPVKLAELGWQMIECPICGGGAQAFPKPDKAAQSAAVPVVGEVVAWRWIRLSTGKPDGGRFFDGTPSDSAIETAANSYIPCAPQLLVIQPATSITAAELERLQKNDARYRWIREQSWNASELCVVSQPKHSVKLGYDCPSYARLDEAIDAAIAAEGEK